MARWTVLLAAAVLFAARPASAEDPSSPKPAPPAAPAGAGTVYTDPSGGITVTGPPGWTLSKDKGRIPSWARLAGFTDPTTKAEVVVSARRAAANTLARMRDEVTKVYADDPSFKVNSIVELPGGGPRALPAIVVDAVQSIPAPPPPAGTPPPVPAPLPTLHRARAAYFLGGETEYMVYVQARQVNWARLAPLVDAMIQGVVVKVAGSANAPRGEGAFRDEVAGFACKYPTGYGVRLPGRENHVVEFAGASEGPVLGVFRYAAENDAGPEADANSLAEYYKGDEVGGEATVGTIEVNGRSGALVTAKGTLAGKEQVFFVAVVKRDRDLFRLRVAAPAVQADAAKKVFDAFVKSFALTNATGG